MTNRARKFYPTPRDTQIITAVSTHRALTSDQIAMLFWGHQKAGSRARHRLKLLSDNGYLERAEQPVTLSEGRRPLVYFLDRKGLAVAADVRQVDPEEIDWKLAHNNVKWPFLDHLLATNDIRVRLEVAAPRAGLAIAAWVDDKSLATHSMRDVLTVASASGGREQMTVGPDGYVALLDRNGTTQHRAFIEADRGTVPLTRWAHKVRKYLVYFRSRAFRERYHARKPFRVLTLTTSERRMANMKQVTEAAGGRNWFWFSTYEATRDPEALLFSPTWWMAGADEPVCFPYPPK